MRRFVLLAALAVVCIATPPIAHADALSDTRAWALEWDARFWSGYERCSLAELCLNLSLDFPCPTIETPEDDCVDAAAWAAYGLDVRRWAIHYRECFATMRRLISVPRPFEGAASYLPLIRWTWSDDPVGAPLWNRVVRYLRRHYGDRRLRQPNSTLRRLHEAWLKDRAVLRR